MLRSLFRRNRTVRIPIDQTEGHQLRSVKLFRRPLSKPSNLITTFFICYFVFRGVDTFILGNDSTQPDTNWEQWKKQQKDNTSETALEHSEHWKKAHEALQKAHGIAEHSKSQTVEAPSDVLQVVTFPIWFRKKLGPAFTPQDAEFKEYAKFQSDKKKQKELFNHISGLAAKKLFHDPVHHRNLHVIEYTGQMHFHFDVIPQLRAPPSYEIPALIVFKDGIGFGWKELSPEIGPKMEAVFNPSATWDATKTSVRAFYTTSLLIVKAKVFGTEPPQIFLRGHKHNFNKTPTQKETGINNNIKSGALEPDTFQWPKDHLTRQELVKALHNSQATKQRHTDLLQNLPLTTAVQVAAHVFRHRQHHAIGEEQQRRARGAVVLRGTAICRGKLGYYKCVILATYLPSEERFVGHITIPPNQCILAKNFDAAQKIEDSKRQALIAHRPKEDDAVNANETSAQIQDANEDKTSSTGHKEEDSVQGTASRPSGPGKEKE